MTKRKASVGRIVHFVDSNREQCSAALVIGLQSIESDAVNLYVFPNSGLPYPVVSVPYSNFAEPLHWHWPEQVGYE